MKKPSYRDYAGRHPIEGLHSEMKAWANAQSKPDLISVIVFSDGSVCETRYPPATKEVKYWCGNENNGYYEVTVDIGNRWAWGGETYTSKGIRELELRFASGGVVESIHLYKDGEA